MIVAFDNSFLTLVLNPEAPSRPNPETGVPASHCRQRIEALIDQLSERRTTVIIPTPVFAEALCSSDDVDRILGTIAGLSALEIVPFDARSAIELAEITRRAINGGDKRDGVLGDWQVIKFDRQIVSIAKAHRASILYTDDLKQTAFGRLAGLEIRHTWQLDLPPEYAQMDWVEDGKTA